MLHARDPCDGRSDVSPSPPWRDRSSRYSHPCKDEVPLHRRSSYHGTESYRDMQESLELNWSHHRSKNFDYPQRYDDDPLDRRYYSSLGPRSSTSPRYAEERDGPWRPRRVAPPAPPPRPPKKVDESDKIKQKIESDDEVSEWAQEEARYEKKRKNVAPFADGVKSAFKRPAPPENDVVFKVPKEEGEVPDEDFEEGEWLEGSGRPSFTCHPPLSSISRSKSKVLNQFFKSSHFETVQDGKVVLTSLNEAPADKHLTAPTPSTTTNSSDQTAAPQKTYELLPPATATTIHEMDKQPKSEKNITAKVIQGQEQEKETCSQEGSGEYLDKTVVPFALDDDEDLPEVDDTAIVDNDNKEEKRQPLTAAYLRKNCQFQLLDKKFLKHLSEMHPTSALHELSQRLNWPGPNMSCALECGPPLSKMYIFKACVNHQTYMPTVAVDNKKDAKAHAASFALQEMGFIQKDLANPL